ncbi:MAG: hypothetical protein NVS1B10_00660 [Candidatus Saccharimonadales bacterium]
MEINPEVGYDSAKYRQISEQVNAVYHAIGAKVVREITYSGEPAKVSLFMPRILSMAEIKFSNRPA